jgi:hypothetical protein
LAAPELAVLYAGGYKNIIIPSMAGGQVTSLSASGAGARAIKGTGGQWFVTVPQTSGAQVSITWQGKANGSTSTKSFGPERYTILKAPTPKVLTKEARKGSPTFVNCSLDPSNPLKSKLKYECTGGTITYGSMQESFSGASIPSNLIRSIPRNSIMMLEATAKPKGGGRPIACDPVPIKIK